MRLTVSRKSDIALKAVALISGAKLGISGRELCDELGVGQAYLSQCLTPLVASGWIDSRTGPDGGYQLAKGLRSLSVGQVVEAIEGPVAGSDCVLSGRACNVAGDQCAFHETWAKARGALRTALLKQPAI